MVGNFFSKLFSGGKSKATNGVQDLVENTLKGLIEKSNLDLTFEVHASNEGEPSLSVELSGADEEILKDNKGQMLDALQLFLKRVVQHNFADDKTHITVDCGGYREESAQALIERAENLKAIAIEQGKSVYYRALPPKDRKIVHQYLSQDPRVKSRSLGDGLYKKIKIYPVKAKNNQASDEAIND